MAEDEVENPGYHGGFRFQGDDEKPPEKVPENEEVALDFDPEAWEASQRVHSDEPVLGLGNASNEPWRAPDLSSSNPQSGSSGPYAPPQQPGNGGPYYPPQSPGQGGPYYPAQPGAANGAAPPSYPPGPSGQYPYEPTPSQGNEYPPQYQQSSGVPYFPPQGTGGPGFSNNQGPGYPPSSPQSYGGSPQGLFSGRVGRMGYFLSGVYLMGGILGVMLTVGFLARVIHIPFMFILVTLAAYLVAAVLGISQGMRRWHDLGKPGSFVFLSFIPLVGFIASLYALFAAGEPGPNAYGNPPAGDNSPRGVFGL